MITNLIIFAKILPKTNHQTLIFGVSQQKRLKANDLLQKIHKFVISAVKSNIISEQHLFLYIYFFFIETTKNICS